MLTRYEFLQEVKEEIGEIDFQHVYSSLETEYYELVEKEIKDGKTITMDVYNSLTEGQRYHFNKHYNHRLDKVEGMLKAEETEVCEEINCTIEVPEEINISRKAVTENVNQTEVLQMNAYSTNVFNLELDQEQPTKVIIKAQLSDYSNTYVKIGSFNFLYNEGSFKQLNGEYKDVKRFSTILNYFSKQNEFFGWQAGIVDQAKQNAKQMKAQEKKEALEYARQLQTDRAMDLLNKLNNKEESLSDNVSNLNELSDSELLERINNTFNNKISKQLANDILVAIRSYATIENVLSIDNNDNLITNEETTNTPDQNTNEQTPELFHLYSNTFNSYNEAYNYALNNRITVTMILSNLHPAMTNERLKQLENEYVFSKHNMSIESMKEYYNYIESLPNTLDKEERYYKLKSLIQRYEAKQERIRQRKEEDIQLAMQDKETMEYMLSNGLSIEFTESGMQKYNLNDQTIHVWSGGSLSANEYHDMIMKMYNNHFNEVSV